MAEFEVWHVLPAGAMPTVRQVLECGSLWRCLPYGGAVYMTVDSNGVAWTEAGTNVAARVWRNNVHFGAQFAVINPRPLDAPMPTPEQVGESSRWRVLCAHKPEGDACTLRTVDGRIEALFDGDDQWVPLASQWGAGMVAVREVTNG